MIRNIVRWFASKTVRQATELMQQARKVIRHQSDLLAPEKVQALYQDIEKLRLTVYGTGSVSDIQAGMKELEASASKVLKIYPNAGLRENIEVFLLAGVLAIGVRTFFLQPMAIPSGSAQPTYFGIVHENFRDRPEVVLPTGFKKFFERWVKGISYFDVKAKDSGAFRVIDKEPNRVLLFFKRQRFKVGNTTQTVWFPADSLWDRAGIWPGQHFNRGDSVIRLKVVSGDHLFVDRFTYHFRRPHRGETIVFSSQGIPKLIPNTHYIKRLVGLGGEEIQLGDDRHLVVNGQRLDANDPGFEMVYSFKGPPEVDHYSGHVNQTVARQFNRMPLATLFPNELTVYRIRDHHYLAMGDNTMNSYDGRDWGDFPREKVIGKSCFVFWPITDRFGWGQF